MEPNSDIFCLQLKTWGKLIAWVQISFNSISILVWSFSLVTPVVVAMASPSKIEKFGTKVIITNTTVSLESVLVMTIFLTVCLLGIVMGLFLLKGVNEGSMYHLNIWILFALISFIVSLLVACTGHEAAYAIPHVLVIGVMYSFTLWVIHQIKAQVKEGQGKGGGGDKKMEMGPNEFQP